MSVQLPDDARREGSPQHTEGYMDVGADYPAGLYDYASIAEGVPSFDAIDLDAYRRDGFVIVDDAFDASTIESAKRAITDVISGAIDGYRGGIQWERGGRKLAETREPTERVDFVRKLHEFVDYVPALREIAFDERVLAAVRRIVGADDLALHQDMALLKPPHGAEKPWHQDAAYFRVPLDEPLVGIWIAIDEATPESGCMRFIRGGHSAPRAHFRVRDWQMCDTDVDRAEVVATPLRPGGCVLFDGLAPHGTPHNGSNRRRRALQFHYRAAQAGEAKPAEIMAAFGGDNRGVTC